MARYRLNYLARRKPELTHPQFVARWRQHGQLAMSLKEWSTVRRYIQCEVLDVGKPTTYDGAATVEYHSLEHRNANRGATEYHRILREDELQVFESLVSNFSFIGIHEVLSGLGTGPFKIIRYFKRGAELAPEEFRQVWRDDYASKLLESDKSIRSYAQNLPISPERPEGWGLNVDGSEEIWFATRDDAAAFVTSKATAELLGRFAPTQFTLVAEVVTDEVILDDQPSL